MSSNEKGLGRLTAVHAASPAQLQRAVFIAVLSFLFFMAMMLAFYVRQNIGYFLLATAFLLVYIVTMLSWLKLRRTTVEVRENGLIVGGRSILWTEMSSVRDDGELSLVKGGTLRLPTGLDGSEELFSHIRGRIAA